MALNLVYRARTYSSGTAGRAISNVRGHHFIVDDGGREEVGPGEYFLSGIAACGVNMMERIAMQNGMPVHAIDVKVECYRDPDATHGAVSIYDAIRVHIELWGIQPDHAKSLVDDWKRLCPLYGSVAIATKDTVVTFSSRLTPRDKQDGAPPNPPSQTKS